MNEQEFNLKCAEFMGYEIYESEFPQRTKPDLRFIIKGSDSYCPFRFNPYSDASDRNKVIEKMRIMTHYCFMRKMWSCFPLVNSSAYECFDKSMEAAQIKCIESVLNACTQ